MSHISHSVHLSDLGHRLLNSSLHLSLVANTDAAFTQESPKLRCPWSRNHLSLTAALSEFWSSIWDRSVRGSCCAVLMSPCKPSLMSPLKPRRGRVWQRPGSQQDSLAGPCPGVASAQQHQREADLHKASQCLCLHLGTNPALNTGLSNVLGNSSGTVTVTWSVFLLFAQIHPCHLHRTTSMFSFSDSLEADFQHSLFMHLSEMTEVLGPVDQSLQCWEQHKSSLLMKHTFEPFPMSYTTAFWAEFGVSQEPGRWYTSLWWVPVWNLVQGNNSGRSIFPACSWEKPGTSPLPLLARDANLKWDARGWWGFGGSIEACGHCGLPSAGQDSSKLQCGAVFGCSLCLNTLRTSSSVRMFSFIYSS